MSPLVLAALLAAAPAPAASSSLPKGTATTVKAPAAQQPAPAKVEAKEAAPEVSAAAPASGTSTATDAAAPKTAPEATAQVAPSEPTVGVTRAPEKTSLQATRADGKAPPRPAATAAQPSAQTVLPGVDGVPIKVERRLLVTQQRWFFTGGMGYLSRGDYYTSPGLSLTAAHYPREGDAIEVRAHLFFSFLSPAAQDVFQQTGLVPDAQRPVSLVGAGWRHSFAYGKVLLGERVFHFDFQGAAHVGLSSTDKGTGLALMAAPGLLVRLDPRLHLQLETLVVASYEQRSRSFLALGLLPTVAIGVRL